MPRPIFNQEKCKGCGLCVVACRKKLIAVGDSLNSKGYHPAACSDESACVGCTMCAKACPDVAIEINK
jgi:2-oxoglutarate ferredoxin oxidoreductase subunit delta